MSRQKLEARFPLYEGNARITLMRRAWVIGRNYPPEDTARVESAINLDLADGWWYDDEAGRIQCCPSVRVLSDPRLREQMLPFEQRRLELENEYRTRELKAKLAEPLAEVWLHVIKRLEQLEEMGPDERQFLLPFAANLTDGDFAVVMQKLAGTRRERASELADVLAQATENHENVGLFEFATAYDAALRTFRRQMGLQPFSSPGGTGESGENGKAQAAPV
jgi:hypothetical protein